MSDEITMKNSAAEIRAAIDAENERRHSPEAIGAAIQEFARATGYQDNPYSAKEILRFLGDREPTAENLQRAAEERMAWDPNLPTWRLKQFLNGE